MPMPIRVPVFMPASPDTNTKTESKLQPQAHTHQHRLHTPASYPIIPHYHRMRRPILDRAVCSVTRKQLNAIDPRPC